MSFLEVIHTNPNAVTKRMDRWVQIEESDLLMKTIYDKLDQLYQLIYKVTPVKTGYMRSTLKVSGGDGYAQIAVTAYYARFVERGCFFDQANKILTKRGWVQYRHLKIGDYVLTHLMRWRKVTDKFSDILPKIVRYSYLIELENGDKIKVTNNHPVFTDKGWIRADELNGNELVATIHNDLPRFHWRNFKEHPSNYGQTYALRIEKTCNNCGIKFEVKESRVKHHKSDIWYCSSKCNYESRKGKTNNNYGKKHPGLNKGVKRPNQSGQNNPMFDKNRRYYYSEIGFREDLGHKVKSTWEANYCRILKYLNIKYDYEPDSFKLSNGKTYTPDFKISDSIYIEIKGYFNEISKTKVKMFKEEYPNIKLIIINEQKYKNLIKNLGHKLENLETGTATIEGNDLKMKFIPIKKIEIKKMNRKMIYNFSVEDDESYVMNNIVTHNTTRNRAHPFFIQNVVSFSADIIIAVRQLYMTF